MGYTLKGIVILNLDKKSELSKDAEYPQGICEELGVTDSMLETVFDEHKKIRTGPNYLEMQIKRDVSVASFFTGHSSKHFIGKGDHVLTVFLSDEDILPRNFEGQVRRIAFEILPKRKEKKFKELFTKSYELLEKGDLDAYWQERQELKQEIGEKIGWSRSRISHYLILLDKVATTILDFVKKYQIGRVAKNATGVAFDFTEGWFRTSGLYDLCEEYQHLCLGRDMERFCHPVDDASFFHHLRCEFVLCHRKIRRLVQILC